MSEDRELGERLAAIDASPRASWVAELRADLDAAWETGELPHRLAAQRHPPRRQWSTRTWLVASLSVAALAVLLVTLAVITRSRSGGDAPSSGSTPTTPDTTPVTTPAVNVPPTSQDAPVGTLPPAPGTLVVTSAGSIPYPELLNSPGSFTFNADGSELALAGNGYGIRVYNSATLTIERELACPTNVVDTPDVNIRSFVWNPQVAVTWDADSQALLTGLNGAVDCAVVFAPAGGRAARSQILAGGPSSYAKVPYLKTLLWNTGDGTLIAALNGVSPRFSLDGTRIVTDDSGTAKLWDAATGRPLSEFELGGGFVTPELSGDHTRVVLGGQARGLILDARTFDHVADLDYHNRFSGTLAINHDGTLVATDFSNTVSVWDVASGAEIRRLDAEGLHLEMDGAPFAISDVSFSPDGIHIAAANSVAAAVWDLSTGEQVFGLDDGDGPIGNVAFSPDGSLLAIATVSEEPQFFDTATGEQLTHPASTRMLPDVIVFSPDGRTLAEGRVAVNLWTYVRA